MIKLGIIGYSKLNGHPYSFSGIINGIPTHADKYILTDILRKELNFKGVVLTDWEDINKLYDRDKIASSKKEAVKIKIKRRENCFLLREGKHSQSLIQFLTWDFNPVLFFKTL